MQGQLSAGAAVTLANALANCTLSFRDSLLRPGHGVREARAPSNSPVFRDLSAGRLEFAYCTEMYGGKKGGGGGQIMSENDNLARKTGF